MRILIAEDERSLQITLKKHLQEYGAIDLVSDGQQALEKVQKSLKKDEPYKLILLDINMPNVDGLNCLKTIRLLEDLKGLKSDNAAKVIMVTAESDTSTILSAFREQCEAYLVKPVTQSKLLIEMKKLHLIQES